MIIRDQAQMNLRLPYSCMLVSILPIIDVLCQDTATGCISSDSLLNGRRRIVGAVFRASNSRSGNHASQTRLGDDGWCSRRLATDIFDPYIEIDFGRDVLFSSITTQGVPPNTTEALFTTENRFIERYRVEVATGENGNFQYITPSSISFQPSAIIQPAIFPLGQSRINSTNRHSESLPRPVIGQILRINPYEWNDEDYVCTKLEVYGCQLQECRSESQLNSKRFVDTVTLNNSPINTDDLFNFVKTERYYCGPTNMRPFTLTITYSSSVLLREIGIHGRDRTFPLSNQYVNSFSLSFSEDGDNFTEYIRDTGSTEFTVSNHEEHFFALWPPITASGIKITINDWSSQPCMSLLMVGCNYSDVVNHSADGTTGSLDIGLLDSLTVVLTTTESVTTTKTLLQATTVNYTQTITESFMVTVTADSTSTPSPSPTQSSNVAASASCSSDSDSTPIYIAVAIVIVGLLITITANIVGVILCCRCQQEKQSNDPLAVKYRNENTSLVETKRNLYAGEGSNGELKLENVKNRQVASTIIHGGQRLETVNLQYESVDSRQHPITNSDYVNNLAMDPATEDNPAHSINSSPPMIKNPAYNVMKYGPGISYYNNN